MVLIPFPFTLVGCSHFSGEDTKKGRKGKIEAQPKKCPTGRSSVGNLPFVTRHVSVKDTCFVVDWRLGRPAENVAPLAL